MGRLLIFSMKKTTAILLLILTNVCVSADNFPATKPFVVPELKSWSAGEGTFVPGEELRVAVPSGDAELLRVAGMLAADWETLLQMADGSADGSLPGDG